MTEHAPAVSSQIVWLSSRLDEIATETDALLAVLLPTEDNEPVELHEAIRYAALGPGKRLRPALVLLCAEAVGGGGETPREAGCAVEMIHAFSLVHDDLPALDDDDLRRGRPTVHRRYGDAVAILTGDALFALAFGVVGGLRAPAGDVVRVLQELATATGPAGLVGGETIDILSEGVEVDIETLKRIHERKTGALIAGACAIGAILGGGNEREIESLRDYGHRAGLAFQIADDILGATSTREALGKSSSDVERGKATYPALFGIEKSREMGLALVTEAVACLGPDLKSEPRALLAELARHVVERLR